MRAKHLKRWIAAAKRRKREAEEEGTMKGDEGVSTDPNWEGLVELVQTALREGRLAEEAT